MKYFSFIVLFWVCRTASAQTTCTLRYPVTAAQLTTEKEVQIFMDSLFNENEPKFKIGSIRNATGRISRDTALFELADSLGLKDSFYKADFDGNGMMDIVVSGNYYEDFRYFAILFQKNNQCRLFWLSTRIFHERTLFRVIQLKRKPALEYYHFPYLVKKGQKPAFIKKTLVFYAGGFVEYNPNVKKHKIEKIEYSTEYCFGTCPVFDLTIDSKRNAQLNARSHNKSKNTKSLRGHFITRVHKSDYKILTNLLNYIDFETLKDQYSVPWTDDQSCTLTITYDGGKVKKIEDYGLVGTYGLDNVYRMLFEMRFNQDWKQFGEKPQQDEDDF